MQNKNKKDDGGSAPKPKSKTSEKNEEYYDNAQLKLMLSTSDSTLYRMRQEGLLPYVKPRGKIYYPKSYFNTTFLEKCMKRLSSY